MLYILFHKVIFLIVDSNKEFLVKIFKLLPTNQALSNAFFSGLSICYYFFRNEIKKKPQNFTLYGENIEEIFKLILKNLLEEKEERIENLKGKTKFLNEFITYKQLKPIWMNQFDSNFSRHLAIFFKQNISDYKSSFCLSIMKNYLKFFTNFKNKKQLMEECKNRINLFLLEDFNEKRQIWFKQEYFLKIFSDKIPENLKDHKYLQHIIILQKKPELLNYLQKVLDVIDEKEKKIIKDNDFLTRIQLFFYRVKKKKITFSEWILISGENGFLEKLQNFIVSLDHHNFISTCISNQKKDISESKRKIENYFTKLNQSHQIVSKAIKNFDLYLYNEEIEEVIKEIKEDVLKNLEENLCSLNLLELKKKLDIQCSKIMNYRHVIFLKSEVYKKIFMICCIRENYLKFINAYFNPLEIEKMRQYTKVYLTDVYGAHVKYFQYKYNVSKPKTEENKKLLVEILKKTNRNLKLIIIKNSDRKLKNFEELDYYFNGKIDILDQIKLLDLFFKETSESNINLEIAFKNIYDQYEKFKEIEKLKDYFHYFFKLVFKNKKFKDTEIFKLMESIQEGETGKENKEKIKLIQNVSHENELYRFILGLFSTYKSK